MEELLGKPKTGGINCMTQSSILILYEKLVQPSYKVIGRVF